ncbi:cytochrome P450 [Minwuia sp.]|uniref:cytochrome P450 n=1 Tax=Minwuia sp. TaxID=2493630 RepID=UPI003A8DFEDF
MADKDLPELDRIDVSDPAIYASDSWQPLFERLRAEAPVHYCADSAYGPFWSVSSHDLIAQAELDTAHFSNRADLGGIQLNDIAPGLDRPAFVSMDKPEHTPRRRAVAPIGNRQSLRAYEDLIRERTAALLAGIAIGEEFDWVSRVSVDLTSMMLATMLGFPQERRHELMYWSDVATANLNAPHPLVKTEDERYAVLEQMADAFQPLWEARKDGRGGFDLITMLANDPVTQDMSRAEFIGTLFLLIVGGNDTTRNSMSGGLIALHDNPDQRDLVRQNPDLIPNMVSEMIRYQTPVIHMRRTALADCEFGGQTIRKGEKLVLWYVSGNRDEAVFEDAEAFRVDRSNARRHLAFGAGIHRCVGDRLAELQLRILWEEVLARGMMFEVTDTPERVFSNFIRGFSSLLVRRVI